MAFGELIDQFSSGLLALGLALPRCWMVSRSLPIFFSQSAPTRVRTACAVALSLPISVMIYYQLGQRPLVFGELLWLTSKEILIGFLLGLLISFPFIILQNIGSWIDQQRGNNMFPGAPGSDPDALPLGNFIKLAGVVLFVKMGFLSVVFTVLFNSYLAWPALSIIPPFEQLHMDLIVQRFSRMMESSILYSAPAIIVLMLIEFGFGLLSIYAQQIQVTTATPALKGLAGMLVLMLGAQTLWYVMGIEFNTLVDVGKIFNKI